MVARDAWTLSRKRSALYDAVRGEGYAAEIRPGEAKGKHVYDVRLAQLASKAEAQALADALRGKMGVAEPRVSQVTSRALSPLA